VRDTPCWRLEAVFYFLPIFRYFLTKKLGIFLISVFPSVKSTNLGKFSPNFRHEKFEKKTLVGREWECVCERGWKQCCCCMWIR
jgi:hypothetical protein